MRGRGVIRGDGLDGWLRPLGEELRVEAGLGEEEFGGGVGGWNPEGEPGTGVGSRWWTLTPHLELSVLYDDNVFLQPVERSADFVFTAVPGFSAAGGDWERGAGMLENGYLRQGTGTGWLFDYGMAFVNFARFDTQDSVDHDARARAQWEGGRVRGFGEVRFESRGERSTDVATRIASSGQRVRRESLGGTCGAEFLLTGKTSLELELFGLDERRELGVSLREGRVSVFAMHGWSERVRVGVGGALGVVNLEGTGSQVYEQLAARGVYSVSAKTDVELRGALEWRDFGGAQEERLNPVFELGVQWRPWEGLDVGLRAHRRVETSRFDSAENLTRVGVEWTVQKMVRERWRLRLGGLLENGNYERGDGGGGRSERFWSVRAGVGYIFTERAEAEAGWEGRHNASSDSQLGYREQLVEMRLKLRL